MSFILHALAQAAVASTPEAVAQAAPTQGVISYPPEFFAASRPANAMEMIGRIPGFNFEGGDSVRGFEGAGGNVLIDGQRPASKSDGLEDVLRRLPASKVARIDLIRGGAPGIDMQGKSVVANIVQKEGSGFHGLMAVANLLVIDDGRNGPAMRLEASNGLNGRNWELGMFAGRGSDDGAGDGPRVRVGPTGTPLIRSRVQSEGNWSNLIGTGAYELPLFGGKFRVNGRYEHNPYESEETNRASFPADKVERSEFSEDSDTTEIGLRFGRDFGLRTKLVLVGLRQAKDGGIADLSSEPGSVQTFKRDSQRTETIGRAVVKFARSSTLSWELGGETALNTLDNRTQRTDNGVAIKLPAANVEVEEKRWEVFSKAVWRPRPAWTVEAGLRQEGSTISSSGDVSLEKTLGFTKPRLALSWSPDEATQIRVRFERVVGQLNFSDFTASSSLNTGIVTAGNPDLSPEQAWVSEAALEHRFWSSGAATVTLRHSALSDVIDRAPVYTKTGYFDAPANIGEGSKDELIASISVPLTKVGLQGAELRATSTWRTSEVTDPTTGAKRDITKLRPQEWEASFTWDMPQYRLTWGVEAFGAWRQVTYRADQIEIEKMKTFVQPFLEWKPVADINLRIELPNITERGFRNTRNVYAGPRDKNPLLYVDDRDIQFGRMIKFRLRKTFG